MNRSRDGNVFPPPPFDRSTLSAGCFAAKRAMDPGVEKMAEKAQKRWDDLVWWWVAGKWRKSGWCRAPLPIATLELAEWRRRSSRQLVWLWADLVVACFCLVLAFRGLNLVFSRAKREDKSIGRSLFFISFRLCHFFASLPLIFAGGRTWHKLGFKTPSLTWVCCWSYYILDKPTAHSDYLTRLNVQCFGCLVGARCSRFCI